VIAVNHLPWAYTIWMSLHEWKVGAAADLRRPCQITSGCRAMRASSIGLA